MVEDTEDAWGHIENSWKIVLSFGFGLGKFNEKSQKNGFRLVIIVAFIDVFII